jgi:hypothetical protein
MIQKNSAKVDKKVCARKKCLGTLFSKKIMASQDLN